MEEIGSAPLGWAGSILMLFLALGIVDVLAGSFGVRLNLVHTTLRAMRRIARAVVRYGFRAFRLIFRMLGRGLRALYRELRNHGGAPARTTR